MFGQTTPAAPARPQRKTWFLLGGIALLAVVSGVAVPTSFQQDAPAAPLAAAAPAAPAHNPATTVTPATGKDDLTYSATPFPEAPDMRGMLVRLAVGTVVVLGLCVGSLWAAKRWLRLTPAAGPGGGQLRLLETLSLGNRCALYLVAAGDRRVLVGVDAAGMKATLALSDGFADALTEAAAGAETAPAPQA